MGKQVFLGCRASCDAVITWFWGLGVCVHVQQGVGLDWLRVKDTLLNQQDFQWEAKNISSSVWHHGAELDYGGQPRPTPGLHFSPLPLVSSFLCAFHRLIPTQSLQVYQLHELTGCFLLLLRADSFWSWNSPVRVKSQRLIPITYHLL